MPKLEGWREKITSKAIDLLVVASLGVGAWYLSDHQDRTTSASERQQLRKDLVESRDSIHRDLEAHAALMNSRARNWESRLDRIESDIDRLEERQANIRERLGRN